MAQRQGHEVSLLAVKTTMARIVEDQRLVVADIELRVVVQHLLGRDLLAREDIDRELLALDEALLLESVLEQAEHVVAVQAPGGAHPVERIEHEQDAHAACLRLTVRDLDERRSEGTRERQSREAQKSHANLPRSG